MTIVASLLLLWVIFGNCEEQPKWNKQKGFVFIQNTLYTPGTSTLYNYYKSHICFKYHVFEIEYIKCCNGYFIPIKNKNVTIYVNENDPYEAYIDTEYRWVIGPIFVFIVTLLVYYYNKLPRFKLRSPIKFY
jgi:hypothetical protein